MSILSLSVADVSSALSGASPLSVISSILKPSYVIRSADGTNALPFDGIISLSAGGSASITTAPVEKGKYQSINKVSEPRRFRCSAVISGLTGFSGSIPDIFNLSLTSQSDILTSLQTMISTAAVYDIETPKEVMESFDLINWSYNVSSQTGVTLLTINMDFQEVMQQMDVVLSGGQSTKKLTANGTTDAVTGAASVAKEGAASTSTLDQLKQSWTKLKTATSTLAGTVTDTVTQTFTSAASTVTKTAGELATSAASKSADIITSINSSIS